MTPTELKEIYAKLETGKYKLKWWSRTQMRWIEPDASPNLGSVSELWKVVPEQVTCPCCAGKGTVSAVEEKKVDTVSAKLPKNTEKLAIITSTGDINCWSQIQWAKMFKTIREDTKYILPSTRFLSRGDIMPRLRAALPRYPQYRLIDNTYLVKVG